MESTLIKKFFNNQCTREEVILVLEWINSLNAKKEFDEHFDEHINKNPDSNFDIESLYEQTRERINMDDLLSRVNEDLEQQSHPVLPHDHQNSEGGDFWRSTMRIAASLIFLLLLGGALYYFNSDKTQVTEPNQPVALISKKTGKGQKLTTMLPDGSSVVMNYMTKLDFPAKFSDTLRVVSLEGEAFFDVVKNPDKPFVIHAGELNISVLGTSFAVKSRVEDGKSTVSLVSGKVEVKHRSPENKSSESIIMSPGESLVYEQEAQTFKKSDFIPEAFLSWKSGVIRFDKASYQEVMKELENWFDVEIKTIGPVPSWKFSAKFENENLKNILQGISDAQNISFELTDKTVVIKTK